MYKLIKSREFWGFILVGAFLLISLFRPEANKFDLSERMDIWMAFGLSLPIFFLCFARRKREFAPGETLLLFAFLLFSAVSFVFSRAAHYGFSEVYLLASVVVMYILLAHQKLLMRQWLYYVSVFLVLVNLGASFLHFFRGNEPEMAGLFFNPEKKVFYFPNAYALFLLMSWPVLFFLFLKRKNFIMAVLLILTFSNLFLTFSRGAFITLLVQVVVLVFLLLKSSAKSLAWLIIGGMVAGFVFNSIRSYVLPINSVIEKATLDNGDYITSYEERISFWKGSVNLWRERPWFGWGPDSFRFIFPREQEILLANSDHPHNLFLKILVERGLFALLAFLLFLFSIFKLATKNMYKLREQERLEIYCLGTAIFGGILHNMVDYNFNFLTNLLIFWIFLAVLRSIVITRESVFPKSHFVTVILLILVIVGVGSREVYYSTFRNRIVDAVRAENQEESARLFKAYEKSIFSRDFYLEWARYYKNKAKPEEAQKGIGLIKFYLHFNPEDATGWDVEGEILRYMGEIFWEYEYRDFKTALDKEFYNNFSFHYHYAEVLKRRKELRDKLPEFKDRMLPVLERYEYFVANNIHFTAQSFNPDYVILLYKLFGEVFPEEKPFFDNKIALIEDLRSNYKLK